MAKYLSAETKSFLRLFYSTLWVLAGITALNVLIILNSLGSNVFKPLQRNIASVAPAPVVEEEMVPATVVIIDCKMQKLPNAIDTQSNQARFHFLNCDEVGRVINQANKNQGDIFPLGPKEWTTDFIQLSEGSNQMTVPLGGKPQSIEIKREIASKSDTTKGL